MVKGQMHICLRDVGRLAGGYNASGAITQREMADLEALASSLSINGKEGREKWAEGVGFGRAQPVAWGEPQHDKGRALDWGDEIGRNVREDSLRVIDHEWLEVDEIAEPESWEPDDELRRYLSALFDHDEHVAYVSEAWDKDGRLVPTRGVWDRTAGQLVEALDRYGSVAEVIGDPKPANAGAWIRFNPMDGVGCKDENVTALRHALVESDSVDVERQAAIIRKLELPVTTLVHSGGKSIHATIKIDADTIEEYRRRVNFLYDVCARNGLPIDTANRNPSRLSRMPGVMRGDKRQRLLDTNIGKASWTEWEDWISDLNDDLPDIEALSAEALKEANLPQKAPELIEGVLREGHKMRLAGPSKAGKSFALIQLAIAIAEGKDWMGWGCRQGSVLYVNLELDRASCMHRIADVYRAKGWQASNAHRLHVWNLRGRSMPMDDLAPKLIRRAREAKLAAVIIDPIYKVLTGDENSAEEMAKFCNQFDRLAVELGCAVIDCHHHSKGNQGQKASRDRASGSGVFARDPDALLDIVELDAPDAQRVLVNDAVCKGMVDFLNRVIPAWRLDVSPDDALVSTKLHSAAGQLLTQLQQVDLATAMFDAREKAQQATAWRIEGTLREFASFKPRNVWFRYPVHVVDTVGTLAEAKPEGEEPAWKAERRASANDEKVSKKQAFCDAWTALAANETPTVDDMMDYLGLTKKTIYNRMKQAGFKSEKGKVVKDEK